MGVDRRMFCTAALGCSLSELPISSVRAAVKPRVAAVAFDALAVFDPRSIDVMAEALFPGRGTQIMKVWRTRQFEYTWLRSTMGRYENFERVTEEALRYAAAESKVDMSANDRDRLLDANRRLRTWPDAIPTLKVLAKSNIRLAILSNFTMRMLEGCVETSEINGYFDLLLSTDTQKTYKPDRRAYQIGVDMLARPAKDILFVASAGWDAAGSKSFGFPTFWVNRHSLPAEVLGAEADATASRLTAVVDYVA